MFINVFNESVEENLDFYDGQIFNEAMLTKDNVDINDLEIIMLEAELEYAEMKSDTILREADINPGKAEALAIIEMENLRKEGNSEYTLNESLIAEAELAINEADEKMKDSDEKHDGKLKEWFKKIIGSIVKFYEMIKNAIKKAFRSRQEWINANKDSIQKGITNYTTASKEKKESLDKMNVPMYSCADMWSKMKSLQSIPLVKSESENAKELVENKNFPKAVNTALTFFKNDAAKEEKAAHNDIIKKLAAAAKSATGDAKKTASNELATYKAKIALSKTSMNTNFSSLFAILKAAATLGGKVEPVKEETAAVEPVKEETAAVEPVKEETAVKSSLSERYKSFY